MTALVDLFACHRLTRLATQDRITLPFRARLARHGPAWAYLVGDDERDGCPWCASLWVGLGVVTVRRIAPRVWKPVAAALAFSAVCGLIAEHWE